MRGTVGRPALPVELSGRGVVGLGLEVGVDFLVVRAADLTGQERHRAHVAVDNRGRGVDAVLDQLGAMAAEALDALAEDDLVGVGAVIALPGLVDSTGRLLVAPNLGWSGVHVPELLAERLGRRAFPFEAENEANLGALAELWEGAGRSFRDFIYVSGERGVGAGIIIGGELFRGAHGFGGELGHATVDPQGEICACGNRGCLETRAALGALLRSAGLEQDAGVGALAERAAAGDERVCEALAEAGRWLGVGVASAANLLNTRGIVVGGYLATLARWLAARRGGGARRPRAVVRVGRAGRRRLRARRRGGRARRVGVGSAAGLRRPRNRRRALTRITRPARAARRPPGAAPATPRQATARRSTASSSIGSGRLYGRRRKRSKAPSTPKRGPAARRTPWRSATAASAVLRGRVELDPQRQPAARAARSATPAASRAQRGGERVAPRAQRRRAGASRTASAPASSSTAIELLEHRAARCRARRGRRRGAGRAPGSRGSSRSAARPRTSCSSSRS